jgi:hypothetical protein
VVEMTVPINPCDVALSFILIMGQLLHTVCLGLGSRLNCSQFE